MSVDRQCASALMSIAVAGAQIGHGDLRMVIECSSTLDREVLTRLSRHTSTNVPEQHT